jgi:hypothetical protein
MRLSPILGRGPPAVGQYKRFAAYAIFAYSLFRSKNSPQQSGIIDFNIYEPFCLASGVKT